MPVARLGDIAEAEVDARAAYEHAIGLTEDAAIRRWLLKKMGRDASSEST